MAGHYHYELIGQSIEIIDSRNHQLKGMKGKIIDETKMMLVLDCSGMTRKVLKRDIVFQLKDGRQIDGKSIVKRAEERIKM